MLNTFKILLVSSALSLLAGISPSWAWEGHGHESYRSHEHHEGYSYHRGWYAGYNLALWPDNGCYYNGVLVSSPIVETPVIEDVPAVVESTAVVTPPISQVDTQAVDPADNEITVNVPNASGGYTAVVMKKSGSGFIGPQGEYYPEFPKVSQLSIMYGKQKS